MTSPRHQSGFTMVEVLVALVIVAFGMGALMATLTSAADTVGQLREKSFASWVALNRITEVRLQQRPSNPPTKGTTTGEVDFAGQKWRWQQDIVVSDIPGVLRIDVRAQRSVPNVPDPKGGWAAEATGFLPTAISLPASFSPNWNSNQAGGGGNDGGSGGGGGTGGGGGSGGTAGGGGGSGGGTTPPTPDPGQPGPSPTPAPSPGGG